VKDNPNLNARVTAHPFLAGMSPHHLELLAGCAALVQFQAAEVIFRADETARGFYLIESGTVVIEGAIAGKPHVVIDIISAGDPLGWSWLFEPYLWQYDARTTEPTTAIFFDKTILRKYCDEDLTLGNELFKRMSQVMVRRLHAARAKLLEALHQTDHRE
jgi:CRP/FNR family cyclic AMP-dependent transcriptional regulator